MSNLDNRETGKSVDNSQVKKTWVQRHGAALMFAVFALGAVLMVMMQKKSVH